MPAITIHEMYGFRETSGQKEEEKLYVLYLRVERLQEVPMWSAEKQAPSDACECAFVGLAVATRSRSP
jgi:hypothetical protein